MTLMEFSNKKEEVLDIQLTSYGKAMLAKGKFKPEFYSFFDDDVLYDSRYTSEEEEQNYAQTRIIEETPSLKAQVIFESLENQIKKQISDIRTGKKSRGESFQNTIEKEYALSAPLGKSELSSDNVPSWDITVHGANFDSKTTIDTKHPMDIKIPQLNVEDICFYTSIDGVDTAEQVSETEGGLGIGDNYAGHGHQAAGYTDAYTNGKIINIYENYLVLEVDELHTEPMRENYDIELFLVEDVVVDGNTKEDLTPLSFNKEISHVYDGIYDEERFQEEMLRRDDSEVDTDHADHYFNIHIDKEIDNSVLCKVGYRTDFSKRGYIRVDCDGTESKIHGNQMYDVYDPFGREGGPYGEDC